MAKVHKCAGCDQKVLRARTENRRWQLLNPDPDPAGNVAAYRDGTGTWRARTLHAEEAPCAHEQVYMPHAATCTKPPTHHRQRKGEARHTRGQQPRRRQPAQPTLI